MTLAQRVAIQILRIITGYKIKFLERALQAAVSSISSAAENWP